MAWTLKKPEVEQRIDLRLSLPQSMHDKFREISEESGVELPEVIRQALAYSLKRFGASKRGKNAGAESPE